MLGKINWNPDRRDLRKFGRVLLIGFGLIGVILYRRGSVATAEVLWLASSIIALLSFFCPAAARPFYRAWMGIAFVTGTVMSTVILIVIFYGVITPAGLIMRLFGRDALRLKRKAVSSYWIEHPTISDNKAYERLF